MSNWLDRAKRALREPSFRSAETNGRDRSKLYRRLFAFEYLEPRLTLAAAGLVPVGSQPAGPLSGKIVFVSPGHGYQYDAGAWRTGRGETNNMVEDFGTQDQATLFADYLFRAGATVVPLRPIGRQTNEVVVDNELFNVPNAATGTVTFTGAWTNHTPVSSSRWYDADYGATTDTAYYRFASTSSGSETATATYTPNIPAAGFYPVYTWVRAGTDRTSQLYKINHTGGQTQVRVDHSMIGSGWVYLGSYHFDAGTSSSVGSVVISNQGTAGKVVIADAIRFGNGMGDVPDGPNGPLGAGGTISGKPREEESSIMWDVRSVGMGVNAVSMFNASTTAYDPNVSAPAILAEYMYQDTNTFGTGVYIAIHSNASNGSGRGALGLISDDGTANYVPTPHQTSLAASLGHQVNTDMRALNGTFEFNWVAASSDTLAGQFGEINDNDFRNANGVVEMDASLAEVAFHDNTQDAAIMRDPKGRDQIAKSLYQGVLEYFDNWGGLTSPATAPTAPINVRAVSNASGQVTINWSSGPSSVVGVNDSPPTSFRIYASSDGYGFDGGTLVAGGGTTSATLTGLDPTLPYYFKVVAVNAGGESQGSELVAALPSGGVKQVLIVNGFDRFDRTQDFQYTTALVNGGGNSTVDRVWPRYNNSHDYAIQVATAIQASKPGIHVATTSNEAVISGAVNLTDYNTVIWISGTESTADHTFDATEQTKVTSFINAGGNLFLSGSEIGWDLDQQNNGRTFYESTLLANYVADDAGTYAATANAGGIFASMSSFVFSNGTAFSQLDSQMYDVAFPDVIAPQAGAVSALTYSGGTGGTAAIQVTGAGGKGNIVMFGFPFEAMTNASRRQTAMGNILSFLGAEIDIETRVNGQDADSPTGPILAVGSSASLTYLVTNPGIVSLSAVSVMDDNGTPGNAADDLNATYSSGDTNSNAQLDVGETWTYTATRTVVAGQTTRSGKATGTASSTTVIKTDAANYFGSAPGINLQASVNGDDADSPPGPTITAGGTATFDYVVTNTGNVPLGSVVVWDDNGTPGNPGDDFEATYVGGDSNFNEFLDLDEMWTYSDARTVIAGEYTNTSSASGLDSISQIASSSDPTNYTVPANGDFNSDTNVDAGDFVLWRKNSGTTAGATLAQGDGNGDGMVDDIDYNIWRSQFNTPILGGGAGTTAAGGTETAATGESNQAISIPAPSTASTSPSPIQDAADANDLVLCTFIGGKQRGLLPGRSIERSRYFTASLPRDWSELLNDLAERRARHGATELSSADRHSRLTIDASITDGTTTIDCSVTKALIDV